jgi:hypothetical protein
MRVGLITFAAALQLVASGLIVGAQDMSRLADMLMPSYTAMYYASICASNTTWGRTQPVGPRGGVVHYAEHIKNEIIKSLPEKESVSILADAAGRARVLAREQLQLKVIMGDPAQHEQRLAAWCEGFVTNFAAQIMSDHDRDHDGFLQQLYDAKQPSLKPQGGNLSRPFGFASFEPAP